MRLRHRITHPESTKGRSGADSSPLRRSLSLLLLSALAAGRGLRAQPLPQPSPHAIETPRWFALSLLDFKDEVAEAARQGKRVMVYFGQDGCPYCKALMQQHFGPGPIADKTRAHFVAVALNIWGDREASWLDGKPSTEKQLARALKVQFTPTLMFLDSDGRLQLRLDGYLPPERFSQVLDYVIERRDRELSLAEYLDQQLKQTPALPALPPRPYLMRDPSRLARAGRGAKPLALLFESPSCRSCREMHEEAFSRPALRRLLMQRFEVARLLPGAPAQLQTTPDGRRLVSASAFARELNIKLYPSAVFFDTQGREVFRFDGYLRPFHIESAFDYVASGAYTREPQFQRFVQQRAERLSAQGVKVDLWR